MTRERSTAPGRRKRTLIVVVLIAAAAAIGTAVVLRFSGEKPAHSFAAETAYVEHRPPFAALRTIPVATQEQLADAVSKIRPGDEIDATTAFKVSGEFVIDQRVSGAGAVIDLGTGNNAVRFDYGGNTNLPSVWIRGARNIRIYGGDITNPRGGTGIAVYGNTSAVVWWGFSIHDTAGAGLTAAPSGGPIDGLDLEGSITRWGLDPRRDPHKEKGTGTHAANLGDIPGGIFINNRVAIRASDGPGDAIEIGNPDPTGTISGNTLILEAEKLTYRAKEQVAGNGLQLWGGVPIGANVPYLVTRNTEGRALDANGVSRGVSMAGVRVGYGHASRCCLNPLLGTTEATLSPDQAWDPRAEVTFHDVGSSG
jgi:hypothetical protein